MNPLCVLRSLNDRLMSTAKLRYSVAVVSMTLLLASGVIVSAQSSVAIGWSPAVKISDMPSTVGGASAVGDSNGDIYLLWAANSEGKSEDQVDTIFYRQGNGTEWSPSVDILAGAPGGPWLRVDQLVLDAYGRLALLWHQDRNLVLSIADPSEAGSASSWRSLPLLQSELTYQSDLVAGPDGALHVLVVGQGQNVYYLRSVDAGETWSTVQVSAGSDPVRQYSWASFALGDSGSLYATWTEAREDNNWNVTGVYFSRSTDAGNTWSEPAPLVSARGHGHSSVIALDNPKHGVMVFWNRAVGSVDGRYYALSSDGGKTWSEPQVAYERVSGLTRPPYLFVDSLGQLHMIGAGYDALTSVGGEQIWYSRWESSRWSDPMLINVAGMPMTGNEVFDARLVGGNRLLYTWTDAATKDIWFTSQTLPGPSLQETRLELPTPAAAIPTTGPATSVITPTEPTPTRTALAGSSPGPTSSLMPLIAGAVPAVLLVVVVFLFTACRRRA